MSAETEYYLCQDCTLHVANRDNSGTPENSPWWAERNVELLGSLALVYVNLDPSHPEEVEPDFYPFATSRCDGCGSTLAGSRHIAVRIG